MDQVLPFVPCRRHYTNVLWLFSPIFFFHFVIVFFSLATCVDVFQFGRSAGVEDSASC